MSLFQTSTEPRVFGLPPGVDFSTALLRGLDERLADQSPDAMARVTIILNTERARRRLTDLLSAGPPRLLPRLQTFADLARGDPDLPAAASPLRRRLELSQLTAALIAAQPDLANRSAAFDLADSLAELVDVMQSEGVSPDAFNLIDVQDLSAHWQRSLTFLNLINAHMDGPPVDPQARLRAAVARQIADWHVHPPRHPVIVAGSTGSRGPIALLMRAVANLPQGAVILPGLDDALPPPVWTALQEKNATMEDHPQAGLARLLGMLGTEPGTVPGWTAANAPVAARNRLISLSMRPAPITDQWLHEGPSLVPTLVEATEAVSLIEAETEREEAEAIALCLRHAIETGKCAALITPDRTLARRVSACLSRWSLVPDDSAGRPLPLTPPGILLRLLGSVIGQRVTPVALLSLLKHPLTATADDQRGAHMTLTRKLEVEVLSGGAPFVDWTALRAWADGDDATAWVAWLQAALAPLAVLDSMPLQDHLAAHLAAAEALSMGPAGQSPGALWQAAAGEAAKVVTDHLTREAEAGGTVSPPEYRAIFQAVLSGEEVTEAAFAPHPDIAIWGTLEARTQSADLIILGNLNEGVWPRQPKPDPWLNRKMRHDIGLPVPERQVGLSAHDYQQAMGAAEVVITRAVRTQEAPTVPSRWLLRLTNLLDGLGADGKAATAAMRVRGDVWCELARTLDRPRQPVSPVARPAPCPPVDARPRRLSVTRIETLIRDPYAIYARHVLKLRALDPPGRVPDALSRGSTNHKVLERFVQDSWQGLPDDPGALFDAVADKVLADQVPWPAARIVWRARLDRVRDWWIAGELERRARGAPAAVEVTGTRAADGLPHPFELTAKADRIDLTPEGGIVIYDYKSGAPPSLRQIKAFAKQLPLEAAIATSGGFQAIPPGQVAALEIIGLNQTTQPLMLDMPEIDAVWAEFLKLLGAYADPGTPYMARSRPAHLTYESDYDHLSRLGEWEDGDPFEPEDVG